ncbi:MAG: hydrogenase nickel incorporation protein HypB [Clostridia bacterium]|nr:hydrogenase nickel incorporation protein HypB [Clostridia bacterium]
MDDKTYRIIEIKENIFADNNKDAEQLRQELKSKGTFFLNIMSSPGSGKTTTLTQVIPRLAEKYKIGVMEADIDSDVDAATITAIGAKAIQLHTGGMCHLTAEMTRQGIEGLSEDFDFLILENVGNLVCPAEFDTGSVKNLTILSVPEGDDKPLKYPLMYQVSDLLVINKIDVAPYFDFDIEKCKKNALMRNPDLEIIPISAKTGEGVDELCAWLEREIEAWKNN